MRDTAGVKKISDDEDDTHPNIDTPSLFRWRHEARVERMKELKSAREIQNQKMHDNKKKLKETKEKIEEAKKSGCKMTDLSKALAELEKEAEELKAKDEELIKKERLTPWNVDTISHSGFSKTVFNTKPKAAKEDLTDQEREDKMKSFIKTYEKDMKEFGMLQKYDDSKRYLQDKLHLVCEETANYLVMWCINLQMEDKGNLMEHVAHQCICMQYILELSKHLDVDPRACVGSFYSRIQAGDADYKQSFDDELVAFKERIRKRAEEKLELLMKEVEEEEKQARLGPGGLDPIEVLESLPEELKKCFETKDIPLLQTTIANMPEEEARYHMKRCVDSGLWLPDGGKKE
ncbi:hypothetical protein RUM43_013756 [Polyplax serrata]|uniref:Hsp90 co-chaperone Cdc37 n=1 Tax=Polyplax serrata TaxID=468196 RepID=A0AAN8S665_POLSC